MPNSMMPDQLFLTMMKGAEWEKAKGHLQAMLHFFYSNYGPPGNEMEKRSDAIFQEVENFIRWMEEESGML